MACVAPPPSARFRRTIASPPPLTHFTQTTTLPLSPLCTPSSRTILSLLESAPHLTYYSLRACRVLALQTPWLAPRFPIQWALQGAFHPSYVTSFLAILASSHNQCILPSRFCSSFHPPALSLPPYLLFQVGCAGCVAPLASICSARSTSYASRSTPLSLPALFIFSLEPRSSSSIPIIPLSVSATPLIPPATHVSGTVTTQCTAIATIPNTVQLLRRRTNANSSLSALLALRATRHLQCHSPLKLCLYSLSACLALPPVLQSAFSSTALILRPATQVKCTVTTQHTTVATFPNPAQLLNKLAFLYFACSPGCASHSAPLSVQTLFFFFYAL